MRIDNPALCDEHIKTEGKEIVALFSILVIFSNYFGTFFTTNLNSNGSDNVGQFEADLNQFPQLSVKFPIQLVYNNQSRPKSYQQLL